MARRDARERLDELRRNPQQCEVPGCYAYRQKWGRYCEHHDRVNERTGHPEGHTIRKGQLRPYAARATEFIQEQHQHRGVQAALEWIEELLANAEDPGELHRSSLPSQRVGKWFHKMHLAGITAEEVLSTVVGLYLLRELDPRQFKSDRHFQHMLAIRVLRLVPAPFIQAWCNGEGRRLYHRIGVKMREHLADRLNAALGLLALRMAREIKKRMEEEQRQEWLDRLDGVADPFMKPDRDMVYHASPTGSEDKEGFELEHGDF
ncbi:hypothetical protein DPQ33_04240 [Oceanidesulfovibrio indonesiensis]|uniref:Uncharacterized protein n=1 Tax=Oceanidesulfovibrio indonesiensis TaxID=54767 RepID=A0A7M3MHM1_9BACT|nr:hypothetical protein [Oceanidesulfovibrio indonesiensis]TVM18693.1 hypothetical protein DPQ33_04240 [Oceanidesulfovibrio indonesiensis]